MNRTQINDLRLLTFFSTLVFGLFAHGYCYFNLSYSHDSLIVYQNDTAWQISIGRYMHPFYFKIRGHYYPPALVGFLSLVFIGLAAYGVVRIFEIENRMAVVLTVAMMVTNSTVTLVNATYLHDTDMYMLALLLSVASVYFTRYRYGIVPGAICLAISMGLYQSYLQVAIVLFMFIAIRSILQKKSIGNVIAEGLKGIATLGAGAALYYVGLKVILAITHIQLANSYNGLSEVGQYSGIQQFIELLVGTYHHVFSLVWKPENYHSNLMGYLNVVLLLLVGFQMVWLQIHKKIKWQSSVLLLVMVLLLPLGVDCIYIISKGMVHSLMTYSFFMIYLVIYIVIEQSSKELASGSKKILDCFKYGAIICVSVIIFNNLIFSNQAYLKKDLEYQTTMFTMTRIVERMEMTEGYVPGETPVIFIGTLQESPFYQERYGLNYSATGLEGGYSVTYSASYRWYFEHILGYPLPVFTGSYDGFTEAITPMGIFPAKDCCKIINGCLVVKLAE